MSFQCFSCMSPSRVAWAKMLRNIQKISPCKVSKFRNEKLNSDIKTRENSQKNLKKKHDSVSSTRVPNSFVRCRVHSVSTFYGFSSHFF